MTPNHFSDPKLSCWQAAVASVAHGSDFGPASLAAGIPLRDMGHEMVGAAAVAADVQASTPGQGPSVLEGVAKCASMALEIGLAQANGDMLRVAELRAAFEQYGSCDLRWIECVQEFNRFYHAAKTNKAYKRWEHLSDFVEDSLPARCRIGVIGDWGTGEPRAQAVLRQIAQHKPDILLHLGDIYYACTEQEADLFYRTRKGPSPAHAC